MKEWIAADLGIPCAHEKSTRWLKQQWTGLCLHTNGTDGSLMYDRPEYPPCARAALQSRAARDPEFVAAFRERVLDGSDRDFWLNLVDEIYDVCPPEQLSSFRRRQQEIRRIERSR